MKASPLECYLPAENYPGRLFSLTFNRIQDLAQYIKDDFPSFYSLLPTLLSQAQQLMPLSALDSSGPNAGQKQPHPAEEWLSANGHIPLEQTSGIPKEHTRSLEETAGQKTSLISEGFFPAAGKYIYRTSTLEQLAEAQKKAWNHIKNLESPAWQTNYAAGILSLGMGLQYFSEGVLPEFGMGLTPKTYCQKHHVDALIKRSYSYFRRVTKEAREGTPGLWAISYLLAGLCDAFLGHKKGLQHELEAAFDSDPHNKLINLGLTALYTDAKNSAKARLKMDISEDSPYLKNASEEAVSHYRNGNQLRDDGRLEEAESEFRAAIDKDPCFMLPRINLAHIISYGHRSGESVAELEQLLKLALELKRSGNSEQRSQADTYLQFGYHNRGVELYNQHDIVGSIKCYRESLKHGETYDTFSYLEFSLQELAAADDSSSLEKSG